MNEQFEEYIKALIQNECARDEELKAMTEEKKNKNPKECAKFVMHEAYKMAEKSRNGAMGYWCGIDDAPIINLIVHYYTEDNLEVKDLPSNVKVVTTPKASKPKADKPTIKPVEKPTPKPVACPKREEKKTNVVQLDLFA